jgi:hypothetical protein
MLVLKPKWLVLSLLDLVEGEIQLYKKCDVVGWDHHLVLMFLLTKAWWKLHCWTVMLVAPLGAHP